MKKLNAIVRMPLVVALLAGCAAGGADSNVPTREFTDSLGRTVDVPEEITRVAVTGPLAQIVVFSAAPEKLVALASDWSESAQKYIDTDYCNFLRRQLLQRW